MTSKAATIALLLSATMLSTFCDRNAAANRDAAATALNDSGAADSPRASAAQVVIRLPVLPVRQINDFLRRHGIPLVLGAERDLREPIARSGPDALAVCYVPRLGAESPRQ